MASNASHDVHFQNTMVSNASHIVHFQNTAASNASHIVHFQNTAASNVDQRESSRVPHSVLIIFAIVTTLLVSVHLLALMMSTCMLPHMEV